MAFLKKKELNTDFNMNYIVKSGDSLSKIARDVLGDMSLWPELARINNISNPNLIYQGQVLSLDIPKRVTIDITDGNNPKVIQHNANESNGSIIGWGLFG